MDGERFVTHLEIMLGFLSLPCTGLVEYCLAKMRCCCQPGSELGGSGDEPDDYSKSDARMDPCIGPIL